MDFVPKNERARWKSLDSVASFGWCGSAALGGWLTDKYDYTHTFFITALLQSMGILCFATLLPLVPRIEQELVSSGDETFARAKMSSVNEKTVQSNGNEESLAISQTGTAESSSASLEELLLDSSS